MQKFASDELTTTEPKDDDDDEDYRDKLSHKEKCRIVDSSRKLDIIVKKSYNLSAT